MIQRSKYIFFHLTLMLLSLLIFNSCTNNGDEAEEVVAQDTLQHQGAPELRALNQQIESNPNNAELYFLRSDIFENTGAYEAAIDDLQKAISLDSSKGYFYVKLSDLYLLSEDRRLQLPDSKKAIEVLQNYLENYPNSPEVRLELAQTLTYVSKYQESNQQVETALTQKNIYPEAYYLRGVNFKYLGDTVRAITNFQNALEQDPELRDAYMQLGLLFATKKNKLAPQYLESAIRLDSTEMEPFYALALYYQDTEQYQKAIDIYKRIVNIDPQYRKAHYNLGFIYNELDSLDKAYRAFNTAVKVAPDYADAYYMRGLIAERQGNRAEAMVDFRQTLNIEPEHELAQIGLDRLNNK